MRIWTIQPEPLYEQLKIEKVIHCNPALTDEYFRKAYDWLAQQMAVRVGPPPDGVLYPTRHGIRLMERIRNQIFAAQGTNHTMFDRFVWSFRSRTTRYSSAILTHGISF